MLCVKKWAAILLFIVYTFGATDAYQLLKLPLLVEHYCKHRQESPGLSFSDFMRMHYTGKLVIDDDFQQDLQLPFKTQETECCITIATVIPAPIEIAEQPAVQFVITHRVFNDAVPDFLSPRSIFQPPRMA